MTKYIDMTGKKYGRLQVIEHTGFTPYGSALWKCQCECGNIVQVDGQHLRRGATKSCGCYRNEKMSVNMRTHGLRKHPLYTIWVNMRRRCFNPKDEAYHNYGGRGIIVCDNWNKDFKSFYDWAIVNGYKKGLSIDRINSNGNYEPANCRWATDIEQANNKRNNHIIKINNETHTLAQWCRIYHISPSTIVNRINNLNWDETKAITTPVRRSKRYVNR